MTINSSKGGYHANETTMVQIVRSCVVVIGRDATILTCLDCGQIRTIIAYAQDQAMHDRIKSDYAARPRCTCHTAKLPPCTCMPEPENMRS